MKLLKFLNKLIRRGWKDYNAIRELVAEDARLVFANGDIGQGPEDSSN